MSPARKATTGGGRTLDIRSAAARWLQSALVLAMLAAPPGRSALAATGSCFTSAGLDGGGGTNVVAVDPFNASHSAGRVMAGGDGSGIYLSNDWGATWTPVDMGLGTHGSGDFSKNANLYVDAIAFSPTTYNRVYAMTTSGLFISTDGGQMWVRQPVPGEAPLAPSIQRFTGNLIAIDPTRGSPEVVYAGTGHGVYRSKDGGQTWGLIGDPYPNPLAPGTYFYMPRDITSLALDTSTDTLYAASAPGPSNEQLKSHPGDGYVYQLTDASSAIGSTTHHVFQQIVGSPQDAQEILFLNGALYVVGGTGVSAWFASSGIAGPWGNLTIPASVVSDTPEWESIATVIVGGAPVLLVGGGQPLRAHTPDTPGPFANVIAFAAKSPLPSSPITPDQLWNAATSWVTGAADHQVHSTEFGTSISWWLKKDWLINAPPEVALSIAAGTDFAGQLHLMVAARASVWSSIDLGASWYPAVRGLANLVTNAVLANPLHSGVVHVASYDFPYVESSDSLNSVTASTWARGGSATGGTQGFALAPAPDVAPSPGATPSPATFLGTADNAGGNGEVALGSIAVPWQATGYDKASGGEQPLAIATNAIGGVSYLMVTASGDGVYVWDGSQWTHTQSTAPAPVGQQPITKAVSIAWPPDQRIAYLYDNQSGLWRTKDATRMGDVGNEWTNIWAITPALYGESGSLLASPDGKTVYVAVPENAGSTLQQQVPAGLYRGDGADTASGIGGIGTALPPTIKAAARPGPIAWGPNGALYFAYLDSSTRPDNGDQVFTPHIDVSSDYNASATWGPAVSDSTVYQRSALFPSSISVATDGTIYVSLWGNGVLHSTSQCSS